MKNDNDLAARRLSQSFSGALSCTTMAWLDWIGNMDLTGLTPQTIELLKIAFEQGWKRSEDNR